MKKNGLLALEDGTIFWGESVGADGICQGEIVFNTAMTGYQEILSDPSYQGQIINFTYPHIGNTGINAIDFESDYHGPQGVLMHQICRWPGHRLSYQSLPEFLKKQHIQALSGIDTRKLTHILRNKGCQTACIMTEDMDVSHAIALAKQAAKPSRVRPIFSASNHQALRHVITLDFGIKQSMIFKLIELGCRVTSVPYSTPVQTILSYKPDGIFLSNGPGDPAIYREAIPTLQALLDLQIPIMGICLGHQLLALASGAKTIKMKQGHHGTNHPVCETASGRVFISSQNHGYAVELSSLPRQLRVTYTSLLDKSIIGIERTDVPAFGFQGHPEGHPGPHDFTHLFEQFKKMMDSKRA